MIGGLLTAIFDLTFFPSFAGGPTPLNSIFGLITLLPSIAVTIRRLHDTDRTGWWVLLLVTIVGVFVVIYWECCRGTPGSNRFGPDPFSSRNPSLRSTT